MASCSSGPGALTVSPPAPAATGGVTAQALVARCAQLQTRLPAHVVDQARRDVVPTSPLTAAWGEPAVVLRCGVTEPGPTTQQCVSVNGIDWLLQRTATGYSFRTYGRRPSLAVTVPHRYAPEVNALVDLSQAVSTLPVTARCS